MPRTDNFENFLELVVVDSRCKAFFVFVRVHGISMKCINGNLGNLIREVHFIWVWKSLMVGAHRIQSIR